jgi:hypothetical protein
VVVLVDGGVLVNPTNAELAAYGVSTTLEGTRTSTRWWWAPGRPGWPRRYRPRRERLDTLVVERESIGGQAGSSSLIRNYLGFARGVGGSELAQRVYQSALVRVVEADQRPVGLIPPDGHPGGDLRPEFDRRHVRLVPEIGRGDATVCLGGGVHDREDRRVLVVAAGADDGFHRRRA